MAWFNRFKGFLQDVWKELHRVSWPTRTEVQGTTIVVVVMVLIMAVYLGTLDSIFSFLSKKYIIGSP